MKKRYAKFLVQFGTKMSILGPKRIFLTKIYYFHLCLMIVPDHLASIIKKILNVDPENKGFYPNLG